MDKSPTVIIVGGGTSGLMAAAHAGLQGANVLVLEKNPKLGRKLLLSGGGRCNVTNRTTTSELIRHIPGNGKFLHSALSQFNQEDIIEFFESRGVMLKEEDHGRMFPVSDSARTILNTLIETCQSLNVTFQTRTTVTQILWDQDNHCVTGVKLNDGTILNASSIILSVGGCAYPRTGSTGDGYPWVEEMGHTITPLYPTEAPLLSHDSWIQSNELKGVSLRDVKVSLLDHNKNNIVSHQMDMIFTHFGYSGPAILRCSGHVNQWLSAQSHKQNTAHLCIDCIPNISSEQLHQLAESQRNKQLLTLLKHWIPERFAQTVLSCVELSPTMSYKQLTHSQQAALWSYIKHFPITSYGSMPIDKGFVTGGGVCTKEVNPTTMSSKLISGLYFCGEFLDINGYTGGYNITAAFVTGAVAGQHSAWNAFS